MTDFLLNKQVKLHQPKDAFRTGLDCVLLAHFMPVLKKGKILDMGCGVGGVGLCYLNRVKTDVTVCGVEKMAQFVDYATKNIIDNNQHSRFFVTHADLGDYPFDADTFDGIMTNPPFEEHTTYKSPHALKNVANIESTLSLAEWIAYGIRILKMRGTFCIVHKMERLDCILHSLYGVAGDIQIIPIQTKEGTTPKRVLVIARKGIKGGVVCHDFLTIKNKNDTYTSTAYAILQGHDDIIIKD